MGACKVVARLVTRLLLVERFVVTSSNVHSSYDLELIVQTFIGGTMEVGHVKLISAKKILDLWLEKF